MSDIDVVPGWYGKLPTLGDFASRRLQPDFVDPWDLWLGDGMAAHRAQLGEAWLDAYLQSPVWRFLLMEGALPSLAPQRTLAGVLMPSVDRVGRYFPLTIAAALPRVPRRAAEMEALLGWLHRLEDLALDALHDDWNIDELEAALEALPPPLSAAATSLPEHLAAPFAALRSAVGSSGRFIEVEPVRSRAELATLWSAAMAGEAPPPPPALAAHTFWLADNPEAPRMLVARGLPARDAFIEMLGATGREPNATTTF